MNPTSDPLINVLMEEYRRSFSSSRHSLISLHVSGCPESLYHIDKIDQILRQCRFQQLYCDHATPIEETGSHIADLCKVHVSVTPANKKTQSSSFNRSLIDRPLPKWMTPSNSTKKSSVQSSSIGGSVDKTR